MRKVMASFIEMPLGVRVTFTEGNRSLGRVVHFADGSKLLEMMKKVGSPIEDHNLVERALVERRPGMVALKLNDMQYRKLVETLRRPTMKAGT